MSEKQWILELKVYYHYDVTKHDMKVVVMIFVSHFKDTILNCDTNIEQECANAATLFYILCWFVKGGLARLDRPRSNFCEAGWRQFSYDVKVRSLTLGSQYFIFCYCPYNKA